LPVNNPGKKFLIDKLTLGEYINRPATEIIQSIQISPEDSVMIVRPYRNYIGEQVLGFALWIESLQITMVYEITLKQFLTSWFWIQGFSILLIITFVLLFLILAVYLEKHRLFALDSNPLTHLPGNRSIDDALKKVLTSKKDLTVVYCELDDFKAYNDAYGFGEGDRVIQYTSDCISDTLGKTKMNYKFAGHIGGDDFMFIVPYEYCQKTGKDIGEIFDNGIKQFYNSEDLNRGGIIAEGRTKEMLFYPLMSLSMAGVRSSNYQFSHTLELTTLCAEVKKLAKKENGSVLVMDRRSAEK
ncbi:MAG: diguanylate cyclase, partial [Spirochaetaceae bacterium]|nr:diguanylate cyclase [Spirochaetaceae bacterium]